MGVSLVTGATGFIGSHLVKTLIERGEKIVAITHDCKLGVNKWLYHQLRRTIKVNGDVRDIRFLKRVMTQYEIDKVYHLAAQSIVKHAWRTPVNTFDINVMGTVVLLEACRQLEIPKILVQSTDKVYGDQMDAKTISNLKPTEPYGTSKICADLAAQTFIKTYDMNIAITRMCNVFGFDWNNRIIPNTIRSCLKKESPIIFKNDGSKRQYIYVQDAVDALVHVCNFSSGVQNIATNYILTQKEVVEHILSFFPNMQPRYIEKSGLREIKSQSMQLRVSPPWKPRFTFVEGVQRTIEAFKKWN